MSEILLLATIVMGVLLFDTRRRLGRLEQAAHAMRFLPALPVDRAVAAKRRVETPPASIDPEPISAFVPPPVETAPLVATEPEPQPQEQAAAPMVERRSGLGFEDLFGRKLPIWAGGITLIVAAVLMVKYSIDVGLLSPMVRVVIGFAFSVGLICCGEFARRREDFVRDVRVAQALAGAGVGGLYSATLAAANLYGLVSSGTAFAGLTAITGLALWLALRFGAPCAVLGLIGGLATPAVVQADSPSVPLLAGYLAVVIGAITLLSRRQRWFWLGAGALTGGAGWSLLTIAMGGLGSGGTLSIGLLVILLALGLPLLAVEGRAAPLLRGVTAIVGAFQLALLVAQGHFAPLTWGLYGLLSIAYVVLAERSAPLRRTVAVPMLTALGLAAVWPSPHLALFAAVIAGTALIYGGHALRHLWRNDGGIVEVGLLAAIALGGYAICAARFYAGTPGQELRFALLALAFAVLPMLGAGLGWRSVARHDDARFATLAACSGVLVGVAGLVGLSEWMAPMVFASVTAALIAVSIAARDDRLARGTMGFLALAVAALAITVESGDELRRLFAGVPPLPHLIHVLLRWSAVALAAGALSWRLTRERLRLGLQPLTVLLSYGLVAQVVPAGWLAVATAGALLLVVEAARRRANLRLDPAQAMLGVILAAWALEPAAVWLQAGVLSLIGRPTLAGHLPAPEVALRRLLVPALAGAFALWHDRERLPQIVRNAIALTVGGAGVAGVHILYKQLLLIGSDAAFVRHGLLERTVWEALLLAAGLVAWRGREFRRVALAFVGAGLAHAIGYTLVLHDPLWSAQAVGPWPVLNLLAPAFGIVFVALAFIVRIAPEPGARMQRPADGLRMVVILLFASATLRQLFAGSVLVFGSGGEVESIGQSILAIALAIGFLHWGIRKGLRDWRIASLALMLGAVCKVFLVDASGLEGLLRIVSFLALGFSLIGIGWIYSRQLKPDPA